jgi:hypothetical protein
MRTSREQAVVYGTFDRVVVVILPVGASALVWVGWPLRGCGPVGLSGGLAAASWLGPVPVQLLYLGQGHGCFVGTTRNTQ